MSDHKRQTASKGMDRRRFLLTAWLGSMVALAGTSLAALFSFVKPNAAGGFGGLVRAGKVDEFTRGSMSLVKEGRFYLFRREDGSFLAQWQRCTHLGCSVPWDDANHEFRCPCHGSVYNPLGEVMAGPAPRPLDVFPITIEGGEVFVDTGAPQKRSRFEDSQTARA